MADGVYAYALADGRVRFYVKYRTSNGVQRKRRGFRSERAAIRWRTQTMAAVYRGEIVAVRATFAERFDRWLDEHRPRIEPATYRDYRVHGEKRLKPFFGDMKPSAVTAGDVRRYVAEQVAGGRFSVKTINNSLAVLRVFFAHLEEDGDVVRNPARSSPGARERIKLPSVHREMDYLRTREIPRYLDACGETYRPLAETLIATGLRISEALALTWDDVDFPARTLRVLAFPQGRRARLDEGRSLPLGRLRRASRNRLAGDTADSGPDGRGHLGVPGPARRRALALGRLARPAQARARGRGLAPQAAPARSAPHRGRVLAGRRAAADLRPAPARACLDPTTQQVYGHLEESFLRGAADRVERLIWTPADASDGLNTAAVVPRAVPRPPLADSDAA
jgi:integrase